MDTYPPKPNPPKPNPQKPSTPFENVKIGQPFLSNNIIYRKISETECVNENLIRNVADLLSDSQSVQMVHDNYMYFK